MLDFVSGLWPILRPLLLNRLSSVLAGFSVWLATSGIIPASEESHFVTISVAAVSWLAVEGWTIWQDHGKTQALQEATKAYESAAAQLAAMRKPAAASVAKQ